MSTHSDAVFSKCPPARRWSGSSNASLRRQATTRCWKDYRRPGSPLPRFCAVLAGALLFVPSVLASQDVQPTAPSHPEVGNLTLQCVKVVKQSDLLQNIYTTSSHCNSFILVPFCWINKAS